MISATPTAPSGVDPGGAVARPSGPQVAIPGLKPPAPPAESPPKVNFDPEKMMANLRDAIEHLNKQMASSGRSLGFSFDDVMRAPVVTVKDTRSGEVIRQIPTEAVVKVAHTLEELKGVLYDQST